MEVHSEDRQIRKERRQKDALTGTGITKCPFAKSCKLSRPSTIVQEDNAAPHAHKR